jgi:hypothetical protein
MLGTVSHSWALQIAARRVEHVAGPACGVRPYQRRFHHRGVAPETAS